MSGWGVEGRHWNRTEPSGVEWSAVQCSRINDHSFSRSLDSYEPSLTCVYACACVLNNKRHGSLSLYRVRSPSVCLSSHQDGDDDDDDDVCIHVCTRVYEPSLEGCPMDHISFSLVAR